MTLFSVLLYSNQSLKLWMFNCFWPTMWFNLTSKIPFVKILSKQETIFPERFSVRMMSSISHLSLQSKLQYNICYANLDSIILFFPKSSFPTNSFYTWRMDFFHPVNKSNQLFSEKEIFQYPEKRMRGTEGELNMDILLYIETMIFIKKINTHAINGYKWRNE